MHPYLPHLLADIENAEREDTPWVFTKKSFEEEMEEVEQCLSGKDDEHTFSYFCGLKSENFPPAEQLTNKEMKIVCKAFRHMMFTWNLGDGFPKQLPVALTYEFLIKTLDEETFIPESGFVSFDYCTGYAPECIFKEYCSCLKYWKKV